MFFSQNFAPNETISSLGTIPLVVRDHISNNSNSMVGLEKKITTTFFPNDQSIVKSTMFFSGRSALFHLLKALNLGSENEAIVQSFTCTAVLGPIIHAGLKPVYVDVNKEDFSTTYENVLSKVTSQTKIIILQHTFGIIPEDRHKILDLCREKNIFLLEDAAHGLDPKKYRVPSDFDNHAMLLSFGRSKLISSVFGACIATKNDSLSEKLNEQQKLLPNASNGLVLQCLAYKYISPWVKYILHISPFIGKSIHRAIDLINLFPDEVVTQEKMGDFYKPFDCKYPKSLSTILSVELEKLSKILEQNSSNSKMYAHDLGIPDKNAILRFPYICQDSGQKNQILKHFKQKGIILGTWYDSPIAPKGTNLDKLRYKIGMCPVSEYLSERVINLPLNVDAIFAKSITTELKSII